MPVSSAGCACRRSPTCTTSGIQARLAAPGVFLPRSKRLTACGASQSLRLYLLGQEAMVANPQGSVAGGHVAGSAGGHLPHRGPRHPGSHCGDPNLHRSQGNTQSAHHHPPHHPPQRCSSQVVFRSVCCVLFTMQVHGHCKKNNISGSKHYLAVASGVMMSVFVSPVIAAVTVGKEHKHTTGVMVMIV